MSIEPVEVAVTLVSTAVAVVALAALASRLRTPAPLLLLVAGIISSFLPFTENIELTPDVVLLGLLPPLLYSAAIRTSVGDLRSAYRGIALLSVALVAVTALAVGLVAWLLLPVPFAAAFALGAVVAPPDAVAATAIARRVGLPRSVVTILEGESLFNDATAITCLRVGVLALSAAVGPLDVAGAFALAAVGGVAVGAAVAAVVAVVRRRVVDPTFDTAISLIVPFAAYLGADALHLGPDHASGVISVVVAGVALGHRAPVIQTAQSRLSERTNWRTVSFLLENAVFLLIGMQARAIVTAAVRSPLGFPLVVGATVAVLATVVVVRGAWVAAQRWLLFARTPGSSRPPWAASAVIAWAGMRGVVTLAAAFLLPGDTPYREVLVFCALGVTAGTLLLQGTTLAPLARRLGLRGPSARQDALATADLLQTVSAAGLRRLEEARTEDDDADAVEVLRDRITRAPHGVWERLATTAGTETPFQQYQRLRRATLEAQRAAVLDVRRSGTLDNEVVEQVLNALDVEESMLSAKEFGRGEDDADRLTVPVALGGGDCEHLVAAATTERGGDELTEAVESGGVQLVCEGCVREGTRPVHLRWCLTCGHVGCCDSSSGRHAARHWEETGHPVMRSVEPGEDWRWCYVDEQLGSAPDRRVLEAAAEG